jgi:hypothetical protein
MLTADLWGQGARPQCLLHRDFPFPRLEISVPKESDYWGLKWETALPQDKCLANTPRCFGAWLGVRGWESGRDRDIPVGGTDPSLTCFPQTEFTGGGSCKALWVSWMLSGHFPCSLPGRPFSDSVKISLMQSTNAPYLPERILVFLFCSNWIKLVNIYFNSSTCFFRR